MRTLSSENVPAARSAVIMIGAPAVLDYQQVGASSSFGFSAAVNVSPKNAAFAGSVDSLSIAADAPNGRRLAHPPIAMMPRSALLDDGVGDALGDVDHGSPIREERRYRSRRVIRSERSSTLSSPTIPAYVCHALPRASPDGADQQRKHAPQCRARKGAADPRPLLGADKNARRGRLGRIHCPTVTSWRIRSMALASRGDGPWPTVTPRC
jgi:hypothetical protein